MRYSVVSAIWRREAVGCIQPERPSAFVGSKNTCDGDAENIKASSGSRGIVLISARLLHTTGKRRCHQSLTCFTKLFKHTLKDGWRNVILISRKTMFGSLSPSVPKPGMWQLIFPLCLFGWFGCHAPLVWDEKPGPSERHPCLFHF